MYFACVGTQPPQHLRIILLPRPTTLIPESWIPTGCSLITLLPLMFSAPVSEASRSTPSKGRRSQETSRRSGSSLPSSYMFLFRPFYGRDVLSFSNDSTFFSIELEVTCSHGHTSAPFPKRLLPAQPSACTSLAKVPPPVLRRQAPSRLVLPFPSNYLGFPIALLFS